MGIGVITAAQSYTSKASEVKIVPDKEIRNVIETCISKARMLFFEARIMMAFVKYDAANKHLTRDKCAAVQALMVETEFVPGKVLHPVIVAAYRKGLRQTEVIVS